MHIVDVFDDLVFEGGNDFEWSSDEIANIIFVDLMLLGGSKWFVCYKIGHLQKYRSDFILSKFVGWGFGVIFVERLVI